jgi:transketolase
LDGRFTLGRPELVRAGGDVLFLAMGGIAAEAVHAADRLSEAGLEAGVAVVSTVQPADHDRLAELIRGYRTVITVEAHYQVGGIGSLAAEVIAGHGLGTRLLRCGLDRVPDGVTGSLAFMYARYGIDRESLAGVALNAVKAR